ncbi:MAG: NAD(P)-binding protein [Bdellovibrionota bacterium]
MPPYIVIGGGLSGLIAAHSLKARGIEFIGLERSDTLGGRALVGHHRLYKEGSVKVLAEHLPDLSWTEVTEAPMERHKGDWRALSLSYSEAEQFYLHAPFYNLEQELESVAEALRQQVAEAFKLNATVVQILPQSKKVICQEGLEFEYEKIVWCCPLPLLATLWKGEKKALAKIFKQTGDEEFGGINLDLEIQSTADELTAICPVKNTVALSFRFKDHVFRTLGNLQRLEGKNARMHWLLFLPPEIVEDREEVAKCVRALKREIYKEFTTLQEKVVKERIVYLPNISGEQQAQTPSIEILPDLFYVGSQIRVEGTEAEAFNLDRALENCKQFENTLA